MKTIDLIDINGKAVRVREKDGELSVDADGRYFTVSLAKGDALLGISVAERTVLFLTEKGDEKGNLIAFSYAGEPLFTLDDLAKEVAYPLTSGTVMTPIETLLFLSRKDKASLVKEHAHYFCTSAAGEILLIDLAERTLVFRT